MASTMTTAATATSIHPPPDGHLDLDRPSEREQQQLLRSESDQSGLPHQTMPQHLQNNTSAENNVSDDGNGVGEEKKDTHFNGPTTPLHTNRTFFEKDNNPSEPPSLSNSQIEQPNNDASQLESDAMESTSRNLEEPDNKSKEPDHQSLEKQQIPPSPTGTGNHDKKSKQRRRTSNAAVIEGDASTAFSHYRPVIPLSCLSENNALRDEPLNRLSDSSKKKRGKRERRDKRDHERDRKSKGKKSEKKSKDGPAGGNNDVVGSAASPMVNDEFTSQTNNAQHDHRVAVDTDAAHQTMNPSTNITDDPIHSIILRADDPILQNYLPQLTFLNDNYYSRVKPYRMGKRNLPMNQIEVILRRRAVKKRVDVQKQKEVATAAGGGVGKGIVAREGNHKHNNGHSTPPPSISRHYRPPPSQNSPPRRKLFPTQQQHSPTPSYGKAGGHYEDDSTISSTTVASTHLTSTIPAQQQQQSTLVEPPLSYHLQQPIIGSGAGNNYTAASAIPISEMPKEEIVGDTSLGLKLTILQGKVILQHITALDDGRASPAQLCGLLNPGDIIIAVNGKSLINGTIHNPSTMDRIISVLKPLSQPIVDEETKEYSREVRLRLVLGEGEPLLRDQQEREKRKLEDRERRKKLGLDSNKMGMDPAADLFGIGAFMGVDQHSGMPMFGHLEHHRREDEKEEKKESSVEGSTMVVATKVLAKKNEGIKESAPMLARVRPTVQAQIAHQVQLDRQWIRNRNTSGFFAMNDAAPALLRPPSPPPDHSKDLLQAENPADVRKQRLERGAQTMADAKSLVSIVESQDRGIEAFEDEDPMEVASRACGTASIRTGASRRRWHRGDSVMEEDVPSLAPSAASDNPNFDVSTIRSGESVEACDHRMLIELAAANESWKMNVLKRLEGYAEETEKESGRSGIHHGSSSESSGKEENHPAPTSFDTFLFGGDVANILGKKKQSLALPPGEMTSMLFDLVELLESGLPNQIFMKEETTTIMSSAQLPPFSSDKSVSFANKNNLERNADDVTKATDFLLREVLGIWLKSFRPLPWKQRRALWPSHQSGLDGDSSMVSSSRMDDNESLSLVSGTTGQSRLIEKDKRNLRELIEDLELDQETRRETCRLVTFYFTRKFSNAEAPQGGCRYLSSSRLSKEAEDEAAALIDAYGSYLDIYKCLLIAGKLHSKLLVDKLVGAAKYDSQHREAMKALLKAKILLFYEPCMLSALLELLPSISTKECSSSLDFIALLVSAYPDLQPWCVHEATVSSEHSGDFYLKYMSSLLNHEDGNDAAKRDEALVKEWCLMLSSPDEADPATEETHRRSFFHIASRDDHISLLYHRDLPFLMDISVKMTEFGLALSLANEIVSSHKYSRDNQVLLDVLQHLCLISDKAIEGNKGEINTILLGQVIVFFNVISPCMEGHDGNLLGSDDENEWDMRAGADGNGYTQDDGVPSAAATGGEGATNASATIMAAAAATPTAAGTGAGAGGEVHNRGFGIVTELEKLLEKCYVEHQNNQHYSSGNIDACISTISENAPPAYSLEVLSKWEHISAVSSSLISALHTSLIRGAREGVRSELSGSLLRIQRAREEGRRPIVENGMVSWNADTQESGEGEEEQVGGFIWSSVLDGTAMIAK